MDLGGAVDLSNSKEHQVCQDSTMHTNPEPQGCWKLWYQFFRHSFQYLSFPRPDFRNLASHSVRIKMGTLLILSALIMALHDRIYTKLADLYRNQTFDEIIGDTFSEIDAKDLQKTLQWASSVVGNLLVSIVNIMLSSVMGMAFVQIFWKRMRNEVHTIAQINSAMSCSSHPFGVGSLKSWRSMFWLSIIPALGIANTQVILFATGSLHVEQVNLPDSCSVLTANLSNANLTGTTGGGKSVDSNSNQQTAFDFTNTKAQVQDFVTQFIIVDEAIPPYVIHPGTDSYNVTFNAPALRCDAVDSSDIFDTLPLPPSAQPNAEILVWKTTYNIPTPDSNLTFIAASQSLALADDDVTIIPDPSDSGQQAVQCVFFNATYNVTVKMEEAGYNAFVKHNETVLNSPLIFNGATGGDIDGALVNFLAIADAFAKTLNGSAAFDPATSEFTPGSPLIVFSTLGEQVSGVPWSLGSKVELLKAIPELVEYVSISLLSNLLNIGSTMHENQKNRHNKTMKEDATILTKITSPCMITGVAFEYSRWRLFFSYGVGISFSSIVAFLGLLAIIVNGKEESMDFSRIIRSAVNARLLEHQKCLDNDGTLLIVEKDELVIRTIV